MLISSLRDCYRNPTPPEPEPPTPEPPTPEPPTPEPPTPEPPTPEPPTPEPPTPEPPTPTPTPPTPTPADPDSPPNPQNPPAPVAIDQFNEDYLAYHNRVRADHHAPALTYDPQLAAYAYEYARWLKETEDERGSKL